MGKSQFSLKTEVKSVIYFASGIFVLISLWTYNPEDRIFFESLGFKVQAVKNACGPMGAVISALFYKLLGLASYGLSIWFFFNSIKILKNKKLELESQLIIFLTLLGSTVSLNLYTSQNPAYIYNPNGGWIGQILADALLKIFNPVGTALILLTFFCVLVVFSFESPFVVLAKVTNNLSHRFLTVFRKVMGLFSFKFKNNLKTISKNKSQDSQNLSSDMLVFNEQEDEEESDSELLDEDLEAMDSAPVELNPTVKMALQRRLNKKEDSFKIESFKRDSAKKISLKLKDDQWEMPSMDLLQDPPTQFEGMSEEEIREKSNLLVTKLDQFSVKGKIVGVKSGPAVTLFEFRPNADIKISKITELADDLSLALASESVRIIAPIPGRDVVGIETSNSKRDTVFIKDIVSMDTFWKDDMKLPIGLGRRADGYPMVVDLRKMPHLLVAGSTGSGKSVFVVSLIAGLLLRHSPNKLKLILVDPKQVDLAAFNDLPHLLMPPIRDSKKAVNALRWAIHEMDKRYRSMSKFKVRDLEGFNEKVNLFTEKDLEQHSEINEQLHTEAPMKSYYFQSLPYIVIIVEEFGDLMAVDKINVEHAVVRLAQMARACGIHLVLAMQSPRKDVVTGLIKTNIPGRISFKVASKMDSRVILDESGAERLLSRGDMLFQSPGISKPLRAHGAYVSEGEVESLTQIWKDQSEPLYDEKAMRAVDGSSSGEDSIGGSEFSSDEADELDERYDEILEQVSAMKEISASMLQRKFRLGYPRAARMIEIFEQQGVVGPANGSKPRKVLISTLKDL